MYLSLDVARWCRLNFQVFNIVLLCYWSMSVSPSFWPFSLCLGLSQLSQPLSCSSRPKQELLEVYHHNRLPYPWKCKIKDKPSYFWFALIEKVMIINYVKNMFCGRTSKTHYTHCCCILFKFIILHYDLLVGLTHPYELCNMAFSTSWKPSHYDDNLFKNNT